MDWTQVPLPPIPAAGGAVSTWPAGWTGAVAEGAGDHVAPSVDRTAHSVLKRQGILGLSTRMATTGPHRPITAIPITASADTTIRAASGLSARGRCGVRVVAHRLLPIAGQEVAEPIDGVGQIRAHGKVTMRRWSGADQLNRFPWVAESSRRATGRGQVSRRRRCRGPPGPTGEDVQHPSGLTQDTPGSR